MTNNKDNGEIIRIPFNGNEVTQAINKAFKDNLGILESHRGLIAMMNKDIARIEKELLENAIGFNFDQVLDNNYFLSWRKLNDKFCICYVSNSGLSETPLIQCSLEIRLKLYKKLPHFVRSVICHNNNKMKELQGDQ